jgi:hypothetical protein
MSACVASSAFGGAFAQGAPGQSNPLPANFSAVEPGAAFQANVVWAPVIPEAVKARARATTFQAKREADRNPRNSIFVGADAMPSMASPDLNIGSVVASPGSTINARYITITSPAGPSNITVIAGR